MIEKDSLLSFGYGVMALASVGLFTFGIETIKGKAKSYIKRTRDK